MVWREWEKNCPFYRIDHGKKRVHSPLWTLFVSVTSLLRSNQSVRAFLEVNW